MKYTKKQIVPIVAMSMLLGLMVIFRTPIAERANETSKPEQQNAAKSAESKQIPTSSKPKSQNGDRTNKVAGADTAPVSARIPGTTQKRYYTLAAPNDPRYAAAWYLQTVNAPSAWNTTTGSSAVTVAVIDTGFALAHQELTTRWKLNSNDLIDGADNDGNGYVDDYLGWDFANGDSSPQAGQVDPNGGGTSHGTEVSGLVGATGNNGVGTSAISWNTSILPLQVIDDSGSGYSDDVANAIYYAVDRGVDVINMSLGTSGDDPIVRAAVDYAFNHNVVVVAAAGNCGNAGSTGACAGQPTGYITFPASYNRVIAVGATTSTNTRASFSSYGERLDVVAPGSGSIVSPTWVNGNGTSSYAENLYGTSYASPIVASSVALIKSIRPSSSVDDVRALIMAGAAKLGSMSGSFYTQNYGHGMLDVGKMITIASNLNTSGEQVPELFQVGGVQSEHSYGTADTIGSGCTDSALTWCTVWLRNDSTNYERYLPYTKTSSAGKAGWNFGSGTLGSGSWEARARQGDVVSTTPYSFFRK